MQSPIMRFIGSNATILDKTVFIDILKTHDLSQFIDSWVAGDKTRWSQIACVDPIETVSSKIAELDCVFEPNLVDLDNAADIKEVIGIKCEMKELAQPPPPPRPIIHYWVCFVFLYISVN